MRINSEVMQDTGLAKIKTLLIAARPRLTAQAREVSSAFIQPLKSPDDAVTDKSPVILQLVEQLKALRTEVTAIRVEGASALSARDLTVRALLETEQALNKLAESYAAGDRASSMKTLWESVQLQKAAKATGTQAGKALGIPWPLQ
jgi:hypothetical protein